MIFKNITAVIFPFIMYLFKPLTLLNFKYWPTGSSTALTVCSKKHWSESCTFNLTNKSSTYDPPESTLPFATGESNLEISAFCVLGT